MKKDKSSEKNFHSEEEAKAYGESFGKYDFEYVRINGKPVILCGTDQAYEDDIWGNAYQMVSDFCKKFATGDTPVDACNGFAGDLASEIRDLVLERYEEEYKTSFVDVFDEY